MKKLVIILPVLIMAMLTMSGCGNTPANADDGDLKTSIIDFSKKEADNKPECDQPNNPKAIKECMKQN